MTRALLTSAGRCAVEVEIAGLAIGGGDRHERPRERANPRNQGTSVGRLPARSGMGMADGSHAGGVGLAEHANGVPDLQYHTGMSQRGIAERTGQSQSEISEVMGGRHIVSYDVLARIADRARDSSRVPWPCLCRSGRFERHESGEHRRVRPMRDGEVGDRYLDGVEIRALRLAKRMTVRGFASFLGVSDRMVSKWEIGGAAISPRPVNQAALDTTLALCDDETAHRFTAALVSQRAAVDLSVDNRGRAANR